MGTQGRVLVVDDASLRDADAPLGRVARDVDRRPVRTRAARARGDRRRGAPGDSRGGRHVRARRLRRGNSDRLPRRVFEPFWRGDAARSSEGAGLGLALSKRIVDSLGGEIEVDSDPD
jgi:hypothetical protein